MFLDELQALTDKGEGGMDLVREYNVTTKIIYNLLKQNQSASPNFLRLNFFRNLGLK